jgi:DNA repair protein RecO (recombination protein O)
MLHEGGGELHTVTGADLLNTHRAAREDGYRLGVGLVGLEAMLRLYTEQERNSRSFGALTRFLDLLDELQSRAPGLPALDPLALSFQLKLLWLSGYLPHLTSCAECGAAGPLAGYSPKAGGAVCERCTGGALRLSGSGLAGIEGLLARPLAEAGEASLSDGDAHEALGVITAAYEYYGGFRLRTLASAR